MPNVIIGLDPSIASFGVSDGKRHIAIKTKPDNSLSQEDDLVNRVNTILAELLAFIGPQKGPITVVVEAPMITPGANHLYDIGFLYSELWRTFRDSSLFDATIIKVSPFELKRSIAGDGRLDKKLVADALFEKHGVKFERDSGHDKAHAYAAVKLGEALAEGTQTVKIAARRGQAKAAKLAKKKARLAKAKAKTIKL